MNVCFFGNDFRIGGANVVALNLANELSERYKVFLVATNDTEETFWGRDHAGDKVSYHNFAMKKERILKMRKKTIPLMKKFIRENDIDVVFAIGYYPAFYISSFLRSKSKCKLVYCEHESPASMLSDKKATLMRIIASRVFDKTVALTKSTENTFVKTFGASEKKVTTIYNWIDDAHIDTQAVYDRQSKKILTVGRISKEKGFDMLADIAKRVFSKHSDWEWHIMGDGPDREQFEKKIKEYGIEKNIVMHGSVLDAARYYGEYSVMALTSYREGLPLTLLEAKAKKLPCISFDVVTGPSEIIRDGQNGYLIPMYDIDMFADRLCALIEDENIRQSFSDNAHLDIDKFKKGKILGQWIELVESLTLK